ncbi:hypothetical protein M430DRAFT_32171 [Amorphotheca resinae ATCC 22711]|uniref:Uncharacterized protein n=1 Tax=Amorphotheca resinae ATCC 22711 TaxID=857342 RepID=A0A2T3BDG2_AMORE|nr:hypothetical protein M430DRAFT_32171 [Amorphotheca resinae ATCC 22711]PSS27441.1 hypothetical protein M430DRAFT_32171 [Amorphotheca resinae ATCC 22711]
MTDCGYWRPNPPFSKGVGRPMDPQNPHHQDLIITQQSLRKLAERVWTWQRFI